MSAPPIYGLTPAQADCARVIAAQTSFEGKSPSYAEIATELDVSQSKSGVHRLVHGLIERGWIETQLAVRSQRLSIFSPHRPNRSLRLTRSPPPFPMGAITITEAGRAYLEDAA